MIVILRQTDMIKIWKRHIILYEGSPMNWLRIKIDSYLLEKYMVRLCVEVNELDVSTIRITLVLPITLVLVILKVANAVTFSNVDLFVRLCFHIKLSVGYVFCFHYV